MQSGSAWFDRTLDQAKADPNILAFWLDGSRGKGRSTPQSDYDCTLIVADAATLDYQQRFTCHGSGVDCLVMTFDQFAAFSAWGSPFAWNRYNYAHIGALVDKTGRAKQLIEEKGRIPPAEVDGFIEARLDHYVNQVYRAAKCRRDGQGLAARIEAAASVEPLLDVLFALEGGRLRPYPKYLEWELEAFPLQVWPTDAGALLEAISSILADQPDAELALFDDVQRVSRALGFGRVLEAWGDGLALLARPRT
jgi:hypothetical protein